MLGSQLCLIVTEYFQRHTPTSQIENSKYDCPRLHRIWVPNTMEPYDGADGKNIYIGFEIIVFGQILPHKTGVSDLRSPNSNIQFRYTPNTMPIKDGLTCSLKKNLNAPRPSEHPPVRGKKVYLYWYSYIVYFLCDSDSEFGAMGSTSFLGLSCPNLLLVFLNLLFLGTCIIFFAQV